ncbi:Hypothetical predicted protein [Octopus vulgaris]|uniref:Uncharacterized protein n=1 Tax=Octopus vulgaris TaxID=6645 RepID=A0AA36EVN9_OCTVU|nr:Hypothetical predicted protein [Octopus vulgaris]
MSMVLVEISAGGGGGVAPCGSVERGGESGGESGGEKVRVVVETNAGEGDEGGGGGAGVGEDGSSSFPIEILSIVGNEALSNHSAHCIAVSPNLGRHYRIGNEVKEILVDIQ